MRRTLATAYPDLAVEWHPTKNGELTPHDVGPGVHRRVWWLCPAGPDHEWITAVSQRTRMRRGCPYCVGQRASAARNLAVARPALAAEWHPHRNGALTPSDVTPGSGALVWWRCPKGTDHEWQAAVYSRAAGNGCPVCSGYLVAPSSSLAACRPDLVPEWHPTKNGALTPRDVVPGSERAVWWRCAAGADHEWRVAVARRAVAGTGCPFCAGRRVSAAGNLAHEFPAVAAEWHPDKNGALTPRDVRPGSKRRVWWQCAAQPRHEWESIISHRTGNGSGCPFCSGHAVSEETSLAATHPEVAAQWHPVRNGALRPEDVRAGSNRGVWWKCGAAPDHEWRTTPNHRTRPNAQGCPFCAHRRASRAVNLAALHPSVAREWHPEKNGELQPHDVLPGSGREVWWRCPRGPDHEWLVAVSKRTRRGAGCPFCAGRRVSVTNCLATLFPRIAEQWHPTSNGELTPATVLASAKVVAWWRCPRGHEYGRKVRDRTVRGLDCPLCE